MTTNNNLKQHARALAAEKGISYTQARRELLDGAALLLDRMATGTGFITRRLFTIQQAQRETGQLPYPFFVDQHGFVQRQDFWRGEPFRLVGFVEDPDVHEVALFAKDFADAPERAVGMHPVFADRTGGFATYTGAVESVREDTTEVTSPDVCNAVVHTPDASFDFTVGVGHLLHLLNDRDFEGPASNGIVRPEAAEQMLVWLLNDPAGQDLSPLDRMWSEAERVTESLDLAEDGGEEAWPIRVALRPAAVAAARGAAKAGA